MIYVHVDEDEFLKVMKAIYLVEAAVRYEADAFPRDCAIMTSLALKRNILSQTYGDFGHPSSEKYKKWKAKFGAHGAWRLTDSLLNAINHINVGSRNGSDTAYFAGIPSGIMNSSKEIVDYAFSLEYGGGSAGLPSRPLVHNTFRDMQSAYESRFLKTRTKIMEAWS